MTTSEIDSPIAPRTSAAEACASMLGCVAGLRNIRAAAAMIACFVVGALLGGLFAFGDSSFGQVVVGALLFLLLWLTGVHAAGVLLMDQARGLLSRSVADALVYGLLCIPKTLALLFGLVLALLAVHALLALLFFVCKLPGIGPVLLVVAFPLAVVVGGLTAAAAVLCFVLAIAAMWEGATMARALAQIAAILRSRFVETVLLLAVAAFMAGVVFFFVAAILMAGFMPAMGLVMSILGAPMMMGEMGSTMPALGAGVDGHAFAIALGSAVLWALALTLVLQVGLLGLNLAYLRVSAGLDSADVEAAMRAGVGEARRKAAEMGVRAKEAAERARAQAQQAAAHRQATPTPGSAAADADIAAVTEPAVPQPLPACPRCGGAVASGDASCRSCGYPLT